MSFRIEISSLSESQLLEICQDLTVKKTTSFWGKGEKIEKLKIIHFFMTDDKYLYVPFHYAKKKFNLQCVNREQKAVSGSFQLKKTFKLRDYQEEAIELANKDIALQQTVFFNLYCSFGKTILGMVKSQQVSENTGTATLILCPLNSIVDSWIGTFTEHSNARVALAGEENSYSQVIICPCHQITKLKEETKRRIGLLIIDEADMYCTVEHVKSLLATQPYYIIACTATYERDDDMQVMLDMLVGTNRIYKISKKPFFVFKTETPYNIRDEDIQRNKLGTIQFASFTRLFAEITERNFLIFDLVMANISEKILILVNLIEHGETIHNGLKSYFETNNLPYTISRYFDTDSEYNDSNILVGTYSKIGRGFDQASKAKGWDGRRFNILILGSSTLKIEQLAGRVFRAQVPVIFDLVDRHDKCENHWDEREAWYLSRNAIIMKIKTIIEWKRLWESDKIQIMYKEQQKYNSGNTQHVKKKITPKTNKDMECLLKFLK